MEGTTLVVPPTWRANGEIQLLLARMSTVADPGSDLQAVIAGDESLERQRKEVVGLVSMGAISDALARPDELTRRTVVDRRHDRTWQSTHRPLPVHARERRYDIVLCKDASQGWDRGQRAEGFEAETL
jgi:hypothetical protein